MERCCDFPNDKCPLSYVAFVEDSLNVTNALLARQSHDATRDARPLLAIGLGNSKGRDPAGDHSRANLSV
jgi:hypothetical protein